MSQADLPSTGGAAPPPAAAPDAWRLESLIGSRVLLGAGLLSLLLGAVFFFRLSAEHHWIPPGVRVLCGLVAGLALLLGGAYLLAKRKTYVAEGLTGLGASVLYLSLWGAYGPLHVLPNYSVAFGAMIAVSATLALVAWKRESQNVALAGLLGGYLTPALLCAGPFDRVVLAVYLAVLSAAMLVLAVRCRYRLVEAASFVAALFYAQAFAPSSMPGQEWSSAQSILVATLLFAEFGGALFFAARRDGSVDRGRIGLVAAEVLAYAGVLELELGWSPHVLAFADAALAAVLLAAVAVRVPATLRLAYAWLGVGVLTRAVAAWGGAHALTMTLAVEGAGLVLIGRARRAARPAPHGLRAARAGLHRRGAAPAGRRSGAGGPQRAHLGRAGHRLGAGLRLRRVRAAYARVRLPIAVDPSADGDYHDLRVLDDGGAEVPYVLDPHSPAPSAAELPMTERGFVRGRGTQAVFDLGRDATLHDALRLRIGRDTFFTRVALDLSDDARTWRTVRDDALVYRVAQDGHGDDTVSFAPTRSRWLRVRVLDGRAAFPLDGATLAQAAGAPPPLVVVARARNGERPAGRPGTQRYTIDLAVRNTAVAALRVDAATPAFARDVAVERSDDGTTWWPVAGDRIARFVHGTPHLDVATGDARARWWRVTIRNGGDAPLAGVRVSLLARAHELVFPVRPGRRYALVFGRPTLDGPAYDLDERLAHDDWQAGDAALGPVVALRPARPAASEPQRAALPGWIPTTAFGATIVLLAGFALRLVRGTAAAE